MATVALGSIMLPRDFMMFDPNSASEMVMAMVAMSPAVIALDQLKGIAGGGSIAAIESSSQR